ncbi:hypothetical protein Aduo_003238 [Ancylostoma duodenale]
MNAGQKEEVTSSQIAKQGEFLAAGTDSSRARRRRRDDQLNAVPPDSDGESLPSLDKIRFDDNPVQLRDPQKERKKREKASVKRIDRKQRREEKQQKATPVLSSTSNDSLPSLNKIRFDDHIVAITDPEPQHKPAKKSKKKKTKEDQEDSLHTAESFSLGDNSDEMVMKQAKKVNDRDRKGLTRASRKKLNKSTEDSTKATLQLEQIGGDSSVPRKLKRGKGSAKGSKEDVQSRRDEVAVEPNIRIGDKLFSREETEGILRKIGRLKNDRSTDRPRRYTNFNRIESCRTSRSASPTGSLRFPPPAPVPPPPAPPISKDSRSRTGSPRKGMDQASRSNFHRIDSCRTSRASSPQGDQGMPRQRVRVGDRFMTIPEAEEVLQRMLKANVEKGKQAAARAEAGVANEDKDPVVVQRPSKDKLSRERGKLDRRAIAAAEAQRASDDSDCNFSHLNKVVRRDDEVTTIVVAFVFGIIAFAVLSLLVSKVTTSTTVATE